MSPKPDIRWKQRFSNLERAFAKLQAAVDSSKGIPLNELETEGLIQRFEYTYELAWKTLQDVLQERGYTDVAGPGPVLEQALQDGLIDNAPGWRKLKKARELTSHTYHELTATVVFKEIVEQHFLLLQNLVAKLRSLSK